jgi:hypothetical protein
MGTSERGRNAMHGVRIQQTRKICVLADICRFSPPHSKKTSIPGEKTLDFNLEREEMMTVTYLFWQVELFELWCFSLGRRLYRFKEVVTCFVKQVGRLCVQGNVRTGRFFSLLWPPSAAEMGVLGCMGEELSRWGSATPKFAARCAYRVVGMDKGRATENGCCIVSSFTQLLYYVNNSQP